MKNSKILSMESLKIFQAKTWRKENNCFRNAPGCWLCFFQQGKICLKYQRKHIILNENDWVLLKTVWYRVLRIFVQQNLSDILFVVISGDWRKIEQFDDVDQGIRKNQFWTGFAGKRHCYSHQWRFGRRTLNAWMKSPYKRKGMDCWDKLQIGMKI